MRRHPGGRMADEPITTRTVVDIFLLLLIGIGPKLALVPFLKAPAGMPQATKRLVLEKMLVTAGTVAAVLLVLGGALTRLLHFSPGGLSVEGRDPLQLAVV